METTKKIAIECIQKEKRNLNVLLQKNKLNIKGGSNAEYEGQKSCRVYRRQRAKWQKLVPFYQELL